AAREQFGAGLLVGAVGFLTGVRLRRAVAFVSVHGEAARRILLTRGLVFRAVHVGILLGLNGRVFALAGVGIGDRILVRIERQINDRRRDAGADEQQEEAHEQEQNQTAAAAAASARGRRLEVGLIEAERLAGCIGRRRRGGRRLGRLAHG